MGQLGISKTMSKTLILVLTWRQLTRIFVPLRLLIREKLGVLISSYELSELIIHEF